MAAALQIVEEVTSVVIDTAEELIVDTSSDMDDVDALFAELESELGAPSTEPVVALAAGEAEPTEEEMAAAGQAVLVEELVAAAQEEMAEMADALPDNSAMATGELPEPVKKGKAPVTKRIATSGMNKSDAIRKALGSKVADYLVLDVNDLALDPTAIEAKIDSKLGEIDKLPIKIGEKAVNFYAHLVNGASLSNYTKMALDLLIKDGELTSKGLRDAYIARPYSIGTANSQTTQLMKLLPTLGLALKTGSMLKVNPDSTLLPMFMTE